MPETPLSDPISPNGKEELNRALPPNKVQHMLMLREVHAYLDHEIYLANHLQELATDHALGTICVENPPYLMAYLWAYRDAASKEEKAIAYDDFKRAYNLIYDNSTAAEQCATLYTKAIDLGINIVCFDSRHTLGEGWRSLGMAQQELERALDLQNKSFTESRQGAINFLREKVSQFQERDIFFNAHPEYKAKVEAIEGLSPCVLETEHSGNSIPVDAVFSKIIHTLSDPNKNAITIAGLSHISEGGSENATGILDECMAINGWQVTDAFIGSEQQVNEAIIKYRDPIFHADSDKNWNKFSSPLLYDHIDFVWAFDSDIVAHPPSNIDSKIASPPLSLEYDVFSNANGVPVDSQFTTEQINPSLIPELNFAIQQMRAAFDTIQNTNKNSESARPQKKLEIRPR